MIRKNEKGQALLLVLLAMAAVMTVVMSVASRSVTDVSISTQEEDALRAFSAAEAGIERSLLSGAGVTGTPDNSVSYKSNVSESVAGNMFKHPGLFKPGEAATFWLVERSMSGDYTCAGGNCYKGNKIDDLCWGAYSNTTYAAGKKPAVVLSIFYDWDGSNTGNLIDSGGTDFSDIRVVRRGYDPDPTRNNSNNFFDATTGSCQIGNTTFAYHTGNINFLPAQSNNDGEINIPNGCAEECLIMIKVKVLYSDPARPEQVGISMGGGSGLPAQGARIESTGTAGESTRKVNVFQSYPEPPSIFDAAAFSGNDFVKN